MAPPIPPYDEFFNPVLQALRTLGGSSTIEEMVNEVATIMGFSDEQRAVLHSTGKRKRTVVDYRTAWARTYLKKYGLIENSTRGVWALTQKGLETSKVDPSDVIKHYRTSMKEDQIEREEDEVEEEQSWRDELMDVLLEMDPSAFERLTQRLLREAGFAQVEVTGRTGDGGIDGKGIMKIGGLLGFNILFQCKRHQNPITARDIRDFRGAMNGRTDKGLFITTSRYTSEAIREATRAGAISIDILDGEQLMDKLKEYSLGVQTRIIETEEVTIDKDWLLSR